MRRFKTVGLPSPDHPIELDRDSSHHLLTVLRGTPGTEVELFDGTGAIVRATVVEIRDGLAVVSWTGPVRSDPTQVPLHVIVGVSKRSAMETSVRMATEGGATHIHPVRTHRTVAHGDRHERWVRIATDATRQCGRSTVPHISPVTRLQDVLEHLSDVADRRVAVPNAPARERGTEPTAILIGPEGGLVPEEVLWSVEHGFVPTGLGPHTLRSDTATAIAVAMALPSPHPSTEGDRS